MIDEVALTAARDEARAQVEAILQVVETTIGQASSDDEESLQKKKKAKKAAKVAMIESRTGQSMLMPGLLMPQLALPAPPALAAIQESTKKQKTFIFLL